MSQTFQCGDNTALVCYLYDECAPAERAAIDSHVALCPACAAELAALESARLQLASWTPPEAELGFQIVRPQAPGPRAQTAGALGLRPEAYGRAVPWFNRPLPAWAQAVAACAIFAAGLSLGVMRGSRPAVSPAAVTIGAAPAAAPTAAEGADLAALERRLRTEMAQLRATTDGGSGGAVPQGTSEAALMARVRTLIDESEQRQRRELALRTAQVVRDFDSQRQLDLAQIQRSFGQIEGLAGAEVREQRQMLNYLMRVSEQR